MNALGLLKTSLGKLMRNEVKDKEQGMEQSIRHILNTEKARLYNISEQLSAHVIDVFHALGNYDIRFDFDPFSLDDCRCDFVSEREVNVICSLKHVPLQSLVIEQDDIPGRSKLRLIDDYTDGYDGPCWEDICSISSTGARYLDTTKLLECFSTSIDHAVKDVNCDKDVVSVGVFDTKITNSLWIQLSEGKTYRINLFPAIRVNEWCENYESLVQVIIHCPKSVVEGCYLTTEIHLVARHAQLKEGEFWRVTFNDIERRIVLSHAFQCANDCYLLLRMLEDSRVHESGTTGISPYHLQTIVLREIFKHPDAKIWGRNNLQRRMLSLLDSLQICLEKRKCLNVFTRVNIFSNVNAANLEEMAKKIGKLRKSGVFQSLSSQK